MVGPRASSSGTIEFIYVKAKLTFFVTLLFTHPRLSVRLPLFLHVRTYAARQQINVRNLVTGVECEVVRNWVRVPLTPADRMRLLG